MSISLTRPISILLVAILGVSLNSCSASHPETIAITHVTVIDATGEAPKANFTVITQGQRISAVGPSSSTPIPNGAKIVDGSGKFLIPGLADMHIHLTGAGEPTGSREFIIPLLIANGITTVRDMGGKVEYLKALRQEINSGKRAGPQIFFTGPYLDGNPPSFQPSVVVQNAAEAVAAVQTLKREGVDFIKVQSRLQPEAYYAIAEESTEAGNPLRGSRSGFHYRCGRLGCGTSQHRTSDRYSARLLFAGRRVATTPTRASVAGRAQRAGRGARAEMEPGSLSFLFTAART